MTIVAPEDTPIPAEDFLDVAYKMMSHPDYYGAVLIIDSISSLMPKKELDGDFSPTRAGLPKILSIFTKKIGQLLPRQHGLIIAITHYIANTRADLVRLKCRMGEIKFSIRPIREWRLPEAAKRCRRYLLGPTPAATE